jgi:hypothetical protein
MAAECQHAYVAWAASSEYIMADKVIYFLPIKAGTHFQPKKFSGRMASFRSSPRSEKGKASLSGSFQKHL